MSFYLEQQLDDIGGYADLNGNNRILVENTDSCQIMEDNVGSIYSGKKYPEVLQMKSGVCVDQFGDKLMELIKSNNLDNAPTHLLFSVAVKILEDGIDRKNGDLSQRVAYFLRKIIQILELRMSVQAENLRNQNNIYKAREEKFQSTIKVLDTLVQGSSVENEVAMKNIEWIKIENAKVEEQRKHEELDIVKLKKEKDNLHLEVSALKQELEIANKMHEKHCLQLEEEAKAAQLEQEKKLKQFEVLLEDSRRKVAELEEFSQSKHQRWKKKENKYRRFLEFQSGAFQDLRAVSKNMKDEVLKTKRRYSEELGRLGAKLKGVADAAQNYHVVLAENRRLYNEVQDLKGNIRVYCRIRPFLPGQSAKQTTIEYVGENGELVVANPGKGKDSHRLFKFNKVFGPAASQEEVFLDTQPLIRSVLDGYSVCIFAYGQTGSGKTYTMSGPSITSKEDWGVNYRALNDLFQIAQGRQSSIIYEVAVQMVEIYNEQVRDLLSSNSSQKKLGIWSTTQPNGLAVPDASIHPVRSTKDVLELMNVGLTNRAVGATALNERSSRSHSVLTVHVRGTDSETDVVLRGSLHLVDLAGSERVDRSEATGDRLREAQHINKSLSALGDVIYALAQKSPHVPYRNSKLTQVLQSSLGGQAKTLMFVQLNPDVDSYSETISTLKFAERVSGVELGAARSNREGREVRELMEQAASLKETISKKEEEIAHLQSVKVVGNGQKRGMSSQRGLSSLRYSSSSPRRNSSGTPQLSRRPSIGKISGMNNTAVSDGDNCSDCSGRQSEASSPQSVNDVGHQKQSFLPSKFASAEVGQNANDDVELLGLGDADSEERLSDISDGGLSMGTETDGSIGSIVELSLFPETTKPPEKSVKVEKASVPSKLPKPSQKTLQAKSSRLTGSSSKILASSRKTVVGSSSSSRSLKRWQ